MQSSRPLTAYDEQKQAYIDWIIGWKSRQRYVRFMGFQPFSWQDVVLASDSPRIIINAARQSGKSTITSTYPCWTAKYVYKSLSIVLAPTESQSQDDMEKVQEFILCDSTYPQHDPPAATHVKVNETRSRIRVVPATQSARGKSKPNVVILDEASQIEDIIYTEVVKPMFTDNPGRLILLSTPHGKRGFFFDIFNNPRPKDPWERYEIRSPWEPVETPHGLDLVPYMDGDEQAYQAERAKYGIKAWFSPRHRNYDEQLENLYDMGIRKYKQEYCCEFVEEEANVFSYSEIEKMFSSKAPADPDDIQKAKPDTIDFSFMEV